MSDRPGVTDVIRAIATGSSVDWEAVETPPADASLNGVLHSLRVIARIAEVHGAAQHTVSEIVESEEAAGQPKLWGPLTLLEQVGRGSYGDVYRAWDPRLDREVALKLLPEAAGDERGAVLVEEARLLARLRHPNIATVYGADRIDGRTGLWMEFINGQDLEQVVRENGPLSPDSVREVGLQLCDALSAVHDAGVLHRDIKASNVRRADDGRIVLLDFGSGRPMSSQTARRELTGTPLYLAPELFESADADARADIYSLGVLLFYLATGSFPVPGSTLVEIREAHRVRTPPRQLVDAGTDLPDRFARAVDQALGARPEDRYASALEMGAALADAHAGGTRWWQRVVRDVAVAAAGLALVTGMWLTLFRPGGVPKVSAAPEGAHLPSRQLELGATVTIPTSAAPRAPVPAGNQWSSLRFEGRDWVLITAFENRTGETVLDGTLEYALERELSNSPFVNVAPRERINDVLQLMLKPIDSVVDARLGREICIRDGGIRALVTGRVEKFGPSYVITSQIINPRDGALVESLVDEAPTPAEVLPAVRRQAFRVREGLGEMLSTIRASEAALEKVTTPSLHALQLYSQAAAFMHGENWKHEPAERLLRQAISEDERFASAYILLSWAIRNQRRSKQELMPYAERAFQLAAQTTDVERYFIVGSYHSLVAAYLEAGAEQNTERRQAISAYQVLMRINPGHYWGAYNLFNEQDGLGQEPEATEALVHAVDVRSTSIALLSQLIRRLLGRGEIDRARGYIRRVNTIVTPDVATHSPDYAITVQLLHAGEGWLDRDITRIRRDADAFLNSQSGSNSHSSLVVRLWPIYVSLGRHAGLLPTEGARLQSLGLVSLRAGELVAQIELRFPGAEQAARDFGGIYYKSIDEPPFNPPTNYFNPAMLLIKTGRLDEIRRLVNRLNDDNWELPLHLALAEGRMEEAARLYEPRRTPRTFINLRLRSAWVIAEGWKNAGDLRKGVSVLEDALDGFWAECAMTPLCPAYWIRDRELLGDLYRESGRVKEAEEIDAELFHLLAEADPDYPVLVRLKSRYPTGKTSESGAVEK